MQLEYATHHLIDLYQDVRPAVLDTAILLTAHGHVRRSVHDGHPTWWIRDTVGGDETVTVTAGKCDCAWPETDGPCAHLVAVELEGLLQDGTPHQDADGVVVPVLERHIERILQGGCTESPYSVNVTVENPEGYSMMFTVRRSEGRAFFAAVDGLQRWLKAEGYRPAPRGGKPSGEPTQPLPGGGAPVAAEQPPFCVIHGARMKASEKAPGTFYCTKKILDGSYCKERVPKDA